MLNVVYNFQIKNLKNIYDFMIYFIKMFYLNLQLLLLKFQMLTLPKIMQSMR